MRNNNKVQKQKQYKHPSNQHHRRHSNTTRHMSLTGVGVQYAYGPEADRTTIQSNTASFQSLDFGYIKAFDDSNVHEILPIDIQSGMVMALQLTDKRLLFDYAATQEWQHHHKELRSIQYHKEE